MTFASLLVFAAALFVAAGSPGPSIAALVARVLSKGFSDVLPFLAAMWLGEMIWLSFAVAGLSAIAESFQPVFFVIKWAGVLYLLFLAWKMWISSGDGEYEDLPQARSRLRMFFAGMTVTLGNPKIMMFYVALLPSIINLHGITLIGWLELAVTMLLVLTVVDLFWILLASKARTFLTSSRAVQISNRVAAGTIAGAAAVIATR